MKINQIFLITLLCSTAMISAADKEEDKEILTFYNYDILKGANIERKNPTVKHYLESDKKETLTGRTFKKLFSNACKSNLPWLIIVNQIVDVRGCSFFDYFDAVELCRQISNQKYNFTSKSSIALIEKLNLEAIQRSNSCLALTYRVVPLYYKTKNSMQFKSHDDVQLEALCNDANGNKISISDISCTLAIALHNDYSQLLPIIHLMSSNSKSLFKEKHSFWQKLFFSLPDEQQQQLLKECNDRFGWNLVISKKI